MALVQLLQLATAAGARDLCEEMLTVAGAEPATIAFATDDGGDDGGDGGGCSLALVLLGLGLSTRP